MQDLYETEYGIFNHLNASNNKPLSSISFHDIEDINSGSLLEEAIRTYVKKQIKDIFNISLLEFLDLPIDIIAMLLEISDEERTKKNNIVDEIKQEFEKK